jgi:hypothetical protein
MGDILIAAWMFIEGHPPMNPVGILRLPTT